MALTINSNTMSLFANRQLQKNTDALGQTFARLSSGLRINTAKDGAAELTISSRLTADILSYNSAVKNTNSALSMVDVADAALAETVSSVQRMKELAVLAKTATLSDDDRNALQLEVDQLLVEVQRIATSTKFNGTALLTGVASGPANKIQVGINAGETLQVSFAKASNVVIGLTASTSIGSGAYNGGSISRVINALDATLNSIGNLRAVMGGYQSRLQSVLDGLGVMSEATTAARDRISSADIATETANLTRQRIMQQASVAVLAQANQQPQIALELLKTI